MSKRFRESIKNCEGLEKMKKRAAALLSCCLFLCVVCGCSLMTKRYNFAAEAGSVYIHEDGQITAAIIEPFDKDYYSLDELTNLTESLIQDYNNTYYGLPYYEYSQLTDEQKKQILLPISLTSAPAVSNGTVSMVLKYAVSSAYTEFNAIDIKNAGGTELYTSTVGATEHALEGTFVKAQGGETQTVEELQKKTDYHLVYVDFATKIYFEHEIAYVSSNVQVLADNAVQTAAGQGSFILYK